MPDAKPQGKIKKTFKYLVSPRMFMSKEDVSKYGGFSLRYQKDMLSEIKSSIKALRESSLKKAETLIIKDKEHRFQVFYDRYFELGVDPEKIPTIHKGFRNKAQGFFIITALFLFGAVYLLFSPNLILIPSWLIALMVLPMTAAVFIKAVSFNYYAWLIEQRLLPESYSFQRFFKSKPFYRPMKKLSDAQISEITDQYKSRYAEIKKAMQEDANFNLDDYGLGHIDMSKL